jgi:hypothetical protein
MRIPFRPVPFAPRLDDYRASAAPRTTDHLRARLIATCIVFALISLPLILQLVPPNGIYGFRVLPASASRADWYYLNAVSGGLLMAAAAVSAALLIAMPASVRRWIVWAAYLAPVSVACAASFAVAAHRRP